MPYIGMSKRSIYIRGKEHLTHYRNNRYKKSALISLRSPLKLNFEGFYWGYGAGKEVRLWTIFKGRKSGFAL